jgi:TIR domain-containing protein/GlcNAc-PI de-N-acetylase
MPENTEPRVFISHSSKDKEVADLVSRLLRESLSLKMNDVRCSSLNGQRFEGGAEVDNTIRKEVLAAKVLIGLVSAASADSAYVLFEMGARWGSGEKLVPVLLPGTGAEALQGPLSNMNALRLDEASQVHQLIEEVRKCLRKRKPSAQDYEDIVEELRICCSAQTANGGAFTFSDEGYVLAIGAHWDDLLLGALGTMIKLKNVFSFKVDVVVLCSAYAHGYFRANMTRGVVDSRSREILKVICEKEGFNDLTPECVKKHHLPDREFRQHESDLTKALEFIRDRDEAPTYTLILSPSARDRNPDHALTAETAFSTFRDSKNLVLEYDIKPYTEDPFLPSVCIGLDDKCPMPNGGSGTIADRKIALLTECCKIAGGGGPCCIENSRHLFSAEALKARMYVNALDNGKNKKVKYAEIFHGRIEL